MVFLWWCDLALCDFVSGVWRVDVVELVEAGVPSFDVDVGAVVGSHDAVFVFHRGDGFQCSLCDVGRDDWGFVTVP